MEISEVLKGEIDLINLILVKSRVVYESWINLFVLFVDRIYIVGLTIL